MLPSATLASLTATGDAITGPGTPTHLVKGLPLACLGDVVSGAVCVGAVTATTSTVISLGRPVATVASVVAGVNPIIGTPVSTAVAVTVGVNDIR